MGLVERYRDSLLGLLPRGKLWANRSSDSTLVKLMEGIAVEFARAHQRALDLVEEADPRTTSELLPEWERFLALPEACAPEEQTFLQRRNEVVAKYSEPGGQSRQYFIDLIAKKLEMEVTITEFDILRAGFRVGDRCYGLDWAHAWQVDAPETPIVYFRAGSGRAGERLSIFGNELLECRIRELAPAHSVVLFAYGG